MAGNICDKEGVTLLYPLTIHVWNGEVKYEYLNSKKRIGHGRKTISKFLEKYPDAEDWIKLKTK